MRCSSCETDNPSGSRFCNRCGAALDKRCVRCAFENTRDSRYCAQCCTQLDATIPAHPETGSSDRPGGERRHLTVLFSDLVGSTEIASHLDPEGWREIVTDYHHAAARAIERDGGSVAQYLGDGVMAYFGWPEAHDNDAERGIHAGIAILSAVTKLNELPDRPKLSVRIGIDSGAVVIGGGTDKSADVFGDTPNIAARVQAAAEPGTVLVTDAVHRLVSGLFVVENRGAPALKGIDRPIQLYRVVQPSGVRGRLQAAAAARELTSFVGREEELRLLMNRWERVLEGEGQMALIIGEAGIGKSRLVQHFRGQIAATPHSWIETAAGAFFQNTPFYPVTEMLREFLAWRGDESADEQLTQLESALNLAGIKPAQALPLIASLLNLQTPAKYPPLALFPEQQRRRLLATLVEWAFGAARQQPAVIATEDLHWADPSTLELIQLLVEQGVTVPLLLVYTARPEFRVPWPMRAHHTQITLNRLSARNVRTIVKQVAAQKALAEDTVAAMIERTGGVPLFVEELTRAVLESGDARFEGREIPATLHDSLMARLDKLGPAKEVAQVGAVIGNEFSYELLHAVHPIPQADLERSLSSLSQAELLHVRGIAPEALYQFKHALVRDAAYEALLKSRRKELHRLVAQTIEDKFPALKEAQPELFARHWTEAGENERAISEWWRAGSAAEARHAFAEALRDYEQALAVLSSMPASSVRNDREVELSQSIARVLMVTRGFAAPETSHAAERVAILAQKSGSLTQLVNLTVSRTMAAFISGDLPAAGAFADQLLELAVRKGDPTSLGYAHHLQVLTRYPRGDLAGVEAHFAAGVPFFDDPKVLALPGIIPGFYGFASWNALVLGKIDTARQREFRMMTVVSRDNPNDAAWLGYFAGTLHLLLGEYERAEELTASSLEISEQHQIPQVAAYSRCVLGSARAQLGRTSEGIVLIRDGIASLNQVGARGHAYLTDLAAAQAGGGFLDEALKTIEEAIQSYTEAPTFLPVPFRVRGEIHEKLGQPQNAEADYRESIAHAQRIGAKIWELRATTCLARLLATRGDHDQARAMLAGIYNSFNEGFDIADLKDAKALLDKVA